MQILVTSLKDYLRMQGVPPHSNDEEDFKLMAYQVITTCKEEREEEAYQAKVAETSTPPTPPAPPVSSSSTPAAPPVLLPANYSFPGGSEGNFISRDIRERQQPNNTRGGGAPLQVRGRGSRGGQRGNPHSRGRSYRGGPYKPRPRGNGGH